tara:strand:+ start:355 stop:459 length:105 start_codon:yes stop_codon:yes gene_type:complete
MQRKERSEEIARGREERVRKEGVSGAFTITIATA